MSTRRMVRSLAWLALAVFLSAGGGFGPSHDSQFRGKPALITDARNLQSTDISPHLEAAIKPGTNVLWCASFQLAWNEACKTMGGDLHFAGEDPMVAILDRQTVTGTDLDSDCDVAVAGRVRDGIYQKIDRLLLEKFHGSASPDLKPQQDAESRPQDVVAYAYLFEKLDFPDPFERLELPMTIAGAQITAFGMDAGKPGHERMAKNVSILDYKSEDDFVIELKTKSPVDHLVLAKITPAATLSQTIDAVQQRRQDAKLVDAYPSDVLRIPKMNFDIARSYDELLGRALIAPSAAATGGTELLCAEQRIRFSMDEKGVVLLSESKMQFGCSAEAPPPMPKHYMVFDKPFLLMLMHDQSKVPYFAVWVDNAELLERAAQ